MATAGTSRGRAEMWDALERSAEVLQYAATVAADHSPVTPTEKAMLEALVAVNRALAQVAKEVSRGA